MVRLVNIERDSYAIWCDYYPEGKDEHGFIKVDMIREEIIQRIASPNENGTSISVYAHHAMMRLIDLKDAITLPKSATAIWY